MGRYDVPREIARAAFAGFAKLAERCGIRRLECVDNILDMCHFKAVLPALASLKEPYHLFYEVKPNLRRDQLEQLAPTLVL